MDSAQHYQAFPTTAQRFDIRPGEHPLKLRLFKSRERLEAMLQDAAAEPRAGDSRLCRRSFGTAPDRIYSEFRT
jgi:hypothetical protein